jgi:endonuclease-8
MPEGDTLFRIAMALEPVVGGRIVTFALPRTPHALQRFLGGSVRAIKARGKFLQIGLETRDGAPHTLVTHLRMNGLWHLYRAGERWRRSESRAVVILGVERSDRSALVAVCFEAPVVRLIVGDHDLEIDALGPDLLGTTFDSAEALRRLRACGDLALGEALLNQRALAGIGNVYKSELLFDQRLDPWKRVSSCEDEMLEALLGRAREVLLANVANVKPGRPYDYVRSVARIPVATPLPANSRAGRGCAAGKSIAPWTIAVYRRGGEPCYVCATPIARRLQGEAQRSTYWCPQCQKSSL